MANPNRKKDEIKYATAQAKLSEDEALRVGYKHGTPLEAGKIAESEPVDLFSAAQNVARATAEGDGQRQSVRPTEDEDDDRNTKTGGGRGTTVPKNKTPSVANPH